MIWVYIVSLVLILVIWMIAKLSKLTIPVVETSISKPFLATAVLIHRWLEMFSGRLKVNCWNPGNGVTRKKNLISKLQRLYPGEPPEMQMYRYRMERLSLMILIVFMGLLTAALISYTAMENSLLKEGKYIYRNGHDGLDINAQLTAGIHGNDEESVEMNITIPARKYTRGEADELFDRLSGEIDGIIFDENDSSGHVSHSLKLPSTVQGYPFSISWDSTNYEIVDTDGTVHNEDLTESVSIRISADCVYENVHRYLTRDLTVYPQELTAHEQLVKELTEAVENNNEQTEALDKMVLPDETSQGRVEWTEVIDDKSPAVLAAAVLLCVLMIPAKESELSGRLKERSKKLLIEYPAFISKLTLYMGAGMSVRNCFLKMGHEYAKSRKKNDPLGMELAITAHELEIGIPEAEAYEKFGKRCGIREYMRFSSLLTQNLKKGSTDLIKLLESESEDAFELRKNEAKKMGEEASTKLLVPMIMMLGVVMIIIMVPAYMSFS